MGVLMLNLALQGGGAHGAFTWGVLDRLLEEPGIEIEGISGTSAGAMNAVMLASGWLQDGREGARQLLRRFWQEVSLMALPELPLPAALQHDLPGKVRGTLSDWMLRLSHYLSPYDMNPFDINPLRALIDRLVDFGQLRSDCPFRLFIAATEVQSGKIRLFRETELSVDHLLASACLPTLHQAIDIDGRSYWDGGFTGNPALYPLIFDCRSDDILVVLLQPLLRMGTPLNAAEISERVAEFGFQSTFLREMRAISYLQQEARRLPLSLSTLERRLRRLRVHLIETDETLASLGRTSKYDIRRHFLESLKARGRQQAACWLQHHRAALGQRSSVDLAHFL